MPFLSPNQQCQSTDWKKHWRSNATKTYPLYTEYCETYKDHYGQHKVTTITVQWIAMTNGQYSPETVHTVTPASTTALWSEDPRNRDFHEQAACWNQTVAVATGRIATCSICLLGRYQVPHCKSPTVRKHISHTLMFPSLPYYHAHFNFIWANFKWSGRVQ